MQSLPKLDTIDLSPAYDLLNVTLALSACENLLADNFTFTSPHDYHISKQTYLQRCWPFSEENPVYQFTQVIVSGNQVIVLYTCETKSLKKFKNTEYFRFENEKSDRSKSILAAIVLKSYHGEACCAPMEIKYYF